MIKLRGTFIYVSFFPICKRNEMEVTRGEENKYFSLFLRDNLDFFMPVKILNYGKVVLFFTFKII